MKQILVMCAVAIAASCFTSCETNNKGKQWDPNAMVSLRPAATPQSIASKANPAHLTPLEIVEKGGSMKWYNKLLQETPISRTFDPVQRDVVNVRLMMWGTDIIAQDGTYEIGFIKGEDMVITHKTIGDTIAYISNAVLRAADIAIKSAYDAGDYETCYTLFDQAFIFQPITGAEWRELKAKGEN